MDPSTLLIFALIAATGVAAAVSFRSTAAANASARRVAELERQLSALEGRGQRPELTNKKAVFDIFVKKHGARAEHRYTFVFENKGTGQAKDFGVLWNNDLISKAPLDPTAEQLLPPAVAPGESAELTLLRGSESAKMCLVWHDESGDWQEQNFSYASAQAV